LKLCGYIYHQGTYTPQAGTEKDAGCLPFTGVSREPSKVIKLKTSNDCYLTPTSGISILKVPLLFWFQKKFIFCHSVQYPLEGCKKQEI